MSAPVERAAEQINALLDGGRAFALSDARSVLNAAVDVDELARVIGDARWYSPGTIPTDDRLARTVIDCLIEKGADQ